MKRLGTVYHQGFALISTLLFLPLAFTILIFCTQLLFFNKVKNALLESCFLYSIEVVESQLSSDSKAAYLNAVLIEKFELLTKSVPLNFFMIDLKFEPIQTTNFITNESSVELSTKLQLSVLSKNNNLYGFTQSYKCGAYLKWTDAKKFYGIIAVKY